MKKNKELIVCNETYIYTRIQDSRKNWYIYFYSDEEQKYTGIIDANDIEKAYLKLFEKHSSYHIQMMMRDIVVEGYELENSILYTKLLETQSDELDTILNQIFICIWRNPYAVYRKLSEEATRIIISIGFSENENEQCILNKMKISYMRKLICKKCYYPKIFIEKLQ